MPSNQPELIVVLGPTASGKSALAIHLAEKLNGEVISADSRQIYRGMDIGTAKPERDQNKSGFFSEGVRHHLLDIRYPDEPYTLADYKRDAWRAIRSVLRRKKLPILAGGTGLYIRAVTENLDIPAVPPNPALRRKLEARLQKEGLPKLFEELIGLDPEAAYVVDGKNPRRVLRALEVALITGKAFTAQKRRGPKMFRTTKIGLNPPDLKERINRRVEQMIEAGLVQEVEGLVRKYGENLPAFDAIGYREIIDYLRGNVSLPQAVALIQKNTWHYARRQMTWWRKDKEIHWAKNPAELSIFARDLK